MSSIFAGAIRSAGLAIFVCALGIPAAGAQGTARSMDIGLSIRAAALGGASNALFWGDELDHWANPALLGYAHALQYEHGRTRLVPGLAANVVLTSDVITLGGGGLGVVMSGKPIGQVKLDYGPSVATDDQGNPIGTFDSYETVKTNGFGVSALAALDAALGLGGRVAHLSRYADISYGMNFKDVVVALAPQSPGGTGSTSARDWGYMVRLTPIDGISGGGRLPLRFDAAYGHSVLSYNDDATITFLNENYPARVSIHHRDGYAFHMAFDPPAIRESAHGLWGDLVAGLTPLISVGWTIDHAKIGPSSSFPGGYPTESHGIEVALAHVVAYRTGHYRDRDGEIDGDTSGWSFGLPIGRWGGGYFETATWPQAQNSGLRDVHRQAFALWVDPLAIWRSR